jgi:hypothetical protein
MNFHFFTLVAATPEEITAKVGTVTNCGATFEFTMTGTITATKYKVIPNTAYKYATKEAEVALANFATNSYTLPALTQDFAINTFIVVVSGCTEQ